MVAGLRQTRQRLRYKRQDSSWHYAASYAERIRTPLLIIHSEQDLRCAIEQGEYLFTLLRLMGRETEMLRFPAEGHELSRSGSPRHRVQRFEAILEWFGRYLA